MTLMLFSVIRRHLEAEVQGLDPALYAPSDAVQVLEELERIERLASAAKALVAPRAAESGQWSREGHVTPEHWLAKKTGSTVRSARDTLATGEKVKQLPKVEAALRKGHLSAEQAAAVADAAAADPSMQDKLLDTAQGDSLAALRDTAERVKAASRRDDPEAEQARIHRQRSLVTYRERVGATTLKATGPRDAMATVKANLEPSSAPPSKPHVSRGGGSRRRPMPSTGWWPWHRPRVPLQTTARPRPRAA